ncbi:flavin containing amine oxidoreductase [Fusarium albosuccineum]|uniref:Amine oxidase n=1 Tax=Fusarium albosuccineum TaxID=1237068 RepID=A0A8H4L5R7_9HYPO|nr:flavin containing amine oxidoreductase [Fusarium albosuccineum]
MANDIYDCIIVGAGYSGLAAAKALVEHESRPRILVLEARERVGGRAKTIHLSDGKYWDVGGSFLGVKQDLMYGLAREYGVEVFPISQKGKHIFLNRGRTKKYSGLIPPLRPWEVIDAGLVLQQLERLVRTVDVEAPWAHRKAKAWDKMTLDQWVRRHTFTWAGRAMMDMGAQAIFGRPGTEISLLHAAFVFKTLGSVEAAFSSQDGLQQDMTKGGGTAIAERIRQGIGGDETVKLNEPVQQVKHEDTGCTVITPKGEYRAKRVIFATPPQFAARVQFEPGLPAEKKALLEATELGAYSKIFATYTKPFWRDRGLRGEATNLDGYLSVAFDATLPDAGAEGKLMAFATGTKSREFAALSDDERMRIALDEFARMFGKEALQPNEFFYHSMLHEEWSAGCPLASPPPGITTSYGEWIRKPVGPIHWAGTETSTRFYGYMEGAVTAGQRAAREVIEALAVKTG